MANDSQILREYLVSLGFKVNTSQQRIFDTSLHKTDLSAKALLGTILGVVAAAGTMVTMFAKGTERMSYAAKLASTNIGNLQAAQYAFEGVGLSAESAQNMLQGMARAMRSNPGLQALIESFGVPVEGRTMDKVALDFLAVLKKMPFYVGSQYAGLFGIGPDEYLLLTDSLDKLKELMGVRKEMASASGVDADAVAEASKRYAQLFRDIQERTGLLKDALAVAMLEPATKFLQVIERGLEALPRWITSQEGKAERANAPSWLEGGGAYWVGRIFNRLWRGSWDADRTDAQKREGRISRGTVTTETAGTVPNANLPLGLRHNNPGNIMRGGRPLTYESTQQGLQAMAGQLQLYYERGIDTVRRIVETYAPASDGNPTEAYIANVARALGVKDKDSLDLSDPQKMAALMSAMVTQEQGAGFNTFGLNDFLGAARSPIAPFSVQQQTTIHVTTDAESAGRNVARQQDRVNQNMGQTIRNVLGVVR